MVRGLVLLDVNHGLIHEINPASVSCVVALAWYGVYFRSLAEPATLIVGTCLSHLASLPRPRFLAGNPDSISIGPRSTI